MSKKRSIRVGLIKAVPQKWNVEANWKLFEGLTLNACKKGAQIVCASESFLDGYVVTEKKGWTKKRFQKVAQSLKGNNYLSKARDLARRNRIHLVFGFTELAKSGCYNSAALINDKGDLLGCYHKTHLLDQDKRFLPGNKLQVWETSLGRIGIMICADRRWPEVARTLKVKGAELIINPTYGMWHLDNEWWMRTKSYENELYICFVHPRVSLITDPEGKISAKLQSNIPDVLTHDIDLCDVGYTMFKHRRPEIYTI